MGSLPITRFPPNGTLEAPLPPVRGFLFAARAGADECLLLGENGYGPTAAISIYEYIA